MVDESEKRHIRQLTAVTLTKTQSQKSDISKNDRLTEALRENLQKRKNQQRDQQRFVSMLNPGDVKIQPTPEKADILNP